METDNHIQGESNIFNLNVFKIIYRRLQTPMNLKMRDLNEVVTTQVTILVDAGVKLYCAAMGDQIVTWWTQ